MTEKEYLDALNKALKWLPKPEKKFVSTTPGR